MTTAEVRSKCRKLTIVAFLTAEFLSVVFTINLIFAKW
jgi:hypothetical protein